MGGLPHGGTLLRPGARRRALRTYMTCIENFEYLCLLIFHQLYRNTNRGLLGAILSSFSGYHPYLMFFENIVKLECYPSKDEIFSLNMKKFNNWGNFAEHLKVPTYFCAHNNL